MAIVLSVTYEDGSTEDIRIKPVVIVAAERKWGGTFPDIEGTCYAAWVTKGKQGDFDEWLASLEDATDHAESSPPLAPAPSPEG